MTPKLRILQQTMRGNKHGAINRLINPGSKSGELLKPFAFLDFVQAELPPGFGFPFHPHSGIATLTYQLNMDVSFVDTEGHQGVLKRQGLEWMVAGGGAWVSGRRCPRADGTKHKASFPDGGTGLGFQLWVPLLPEEEDGPSRSEYVAPEDVPSVGPVKVLLGSYKDAKSQLKTSSRMNLFDVALKATERFTLGDIPLEHDVAFAFVYQGAALVNGAQIPDKEVLVFGPAGDAVDFEAREDCRILFGSAVRHPHELLASGGSVHTSVAALERGQQKIKVLGQKYAR